VANIYNNATLLNPKEIKGLKYDKINGYKHAKEMINALITVDEMFAVATSQPIVFSKVGEDSYIANAVLGLEQNKNLFVDSKNKWKKGAYTPIFLKKFPFVFAQNGDKLFLAYDSECKAIGTKKGVDLFDENDEMTEFTKGVMSVLENFQKGSVRTSKFVRELNDLGILEESTINIDENGQNKIRFTGFLRVNEEKFNVLDDATMLKLVQNGAYKLIVAHLVSMSNFQKLAQMI
jgi:hypothetical protein